MELFYREDRDLDFFSVCERIRKNNSAYISISDIAKKAINQEAQSFYLSPREYGRIIRKKGKVNPGSLAKRELYNEIYTRYEKIKKENPAKNTEKLARIISEQKAPRFYISEARAVNLYYELLKKKNRI